MGVPGILNIKITNENAKLFILLALLPIFIFSVMAASKIIFAVEEFKPSVYETSKLVKLKILNSNSSAEKTVATLRVEIANNPEDRERGLSGRDSLALNKGMLFVFPEPDNYSFWMKDMNFSLDFIWINNDKIVEITENVKPEDYPSALNSAQSSLPKNLVPKNKADKVLEINAGTVKRLNIKVGDKIEIN